MKILSFLISLLLLSMQMPFWDLVLVLLPFVFPYSETLKTFFWSSVFLNFIIWFALGIFLIFRANPLNFVLNSILCYILYFFSICALFWVQKQVVIIFFPNLRFKEHTHIHTEKSQVAEEWAFKNLLLLKSKRSVNTPGYFF